MHVHPTMEGVVADGRGGRHHLKFSQAWDPEHPFVKERPDLFASDPPDVVVYSERRPVEEATAVPGARRRVKH